MPTSAPSVHGGGWDETYQRRERVVSPLWNWDDVFNRRTRERPALHGPAAPPGGAQAYATTALEAECARVASAIEGTRNDTLNQAAFNLGQLVGAGHLDDAAVRTRLADAAAECGLGDIEADRTIQSGVTDGAKQPRQVAEQAPALTFRGGASPADPLTAKEIPSMEELHEERVRRELDRLRAREDARSRLAAETASRTPLPPLQGLGDLLATPDPPQRYRVANLWPVGGRVVLAAPHKAGKSTLVGNLLRSLADGAPFLDTFATESAQRIVLIDDELDERMLRSWLRDQSIQHPERVAVVSLRGLLSSFDLTEPRTRARWVQPLTGADVLILDCLRPVLDAIGLDENREAGRFLEALDELTRAAGIAETLVVHHTGHAGERSRGDSRILDWPDALWLIEREKEGPSPGTADRFFSAYGRDVNVPQGLLAIEGRQLRIAGGPRTSFRVESALSAICAHLYREGVQSGNQIEKALAGAHRQKAVRDALKAGVDRDDLVRENGRQNAINYRLSAKFVGPRQVSSTSSRHSSLRPLGQRADELGHSAGSSGNELDPDTEGVT